MNNLNPAASVTSPSPLVSVVVCTFNGGELLRLCLEGLTRQDVPSSRYEVIIVDNNSTDGSGNLAEEYCRKMSNYRCVCETQQGLSHARNRGCREARGEYLLYLDDDAIPSDGHLRNVLAVIDACSPDIFGGPIFPYYTTPKPSWFRDEYEVRKYAEESGFSTTCGVSGGNYGIRKAILQQLGLFDAAYGMVGNRLGLLEERKVLERYRKVTPLDAQKVYYALECAVQHHVPRKKMKLLYMLRRHYLAGRLWDVVQHEVAGRKFGARLGVQRALRECLYMTSQTARALITAKWVSGERKDAAIRHMLGRAWALGATVTKLTEAWRVWLKKRGWCAAPTDAC